MPQIWKKRGDYSSVQQLMTARSGMSFEEIMLPRTVPPKDIENLYQAAVVIYKNMRSMPVIIIGDYDADGVTSTAMLYRLFRFWGVAPKTIIPRRMTDGYGISEKLVAGIKNSLIITVDNGISALEPIRQAKAQGNIVLVIDHHLPPQELPEADVILDPHVNPEKNPYVDYCGAGLVLKLAECMLSKMQGKKVADNLLANLTVLACIGTISDVMPLTGDNRRIVKQGLEIMNSAEAAKTVSPGIFQTLQVIPAPYNAETIKFKIGPMLNAVGRLYDAGSTSVLKQMINNDKDTAIQYAAKMYAINEKRKKLVDEWSKRVLPMCQQYENELCVVLYVKEIPEGIVGILTGKIAKQMKRPVFIFSDAKEQDLCKGSGRSYGDYDMSGLVSHLLPLCVSGGGHAGAAGVCIQKDKIGEFAETANKYMQENKYEVDPAQYYDLEITLDDVQTVNNLLKCMAPFGEGIEMPVFLVRNFTCVSGGKQSHYMVMGEAANHLKLLSKTCAAVGFDKAKQYQEIQHPKNVDLLCQITENTFRGATTIQLQIIDIRPAEVS